PSKASASPSRCARTSRASGHAASMTRIDWSTPSRATRWPSSPAATTTSEPERASFGRDAAQIALRCGRGGWRNKPMRPCKSLCTALLATACVLAQAQQGGAPSQSSYESRARAQQVGTPSLRMEVSPAHAADARSLLDRCEAIRAERVKGVSTYVVDQSIMRNRVLLPYERMDIRGADGRTFPAFRRAREDGPWSREDLQ